jgi:carbon-monoxide dehydrogenase small subunit
MSDVHLIAVTVNGARHEVAVEARRTLADVLRHDLGYTGTHLGCEHGICGACTVLVEGLAGEDGALNPLQDAFGAHHALQCGFCTPGFLMLATALLRENPDPSDDEIREAMASNICRCTGYQSILEAVRAAADGAR